MRKTYTIDRGGFKVFPGEDATCIEVTYGAFKGETFVVEYGRARINTRVAIRITTSSSSMLSKLTQQSVEATQGHHTYWRLWQIAG